MSEVLSRESIHKTKVKRLFLHLRVSPLYWVRRLFHGYGSSTLGPRFGSYCGGTCTSPPESSEFVCSDLLEGVNTTSSLCWKSVIQTQSLRGKLGRFKLLSQELKNSLSF